MLCYPQEKNEAITSLLLDPSHVPAKIQVLDFGLTPIAFIAKQCKIQLLQNIVFATEPSPGSRQ